MSNIFHIHGRGGGDSNNARGDNIIHTRFGAGGGGGASGLSGFWRALSRTWAALRAWNNRRIAVRELSAMPDAQLRDIGIERYQIRDAVNGAYPGIIRLRRAATVTGAAAVAGTAAHEVKQAA